jgi:uncharacterized protein Yka (UPF0111/DUF47 family)
VRRLAIGGIDGRSDRFFSDVALAAACAIEAAVLLSDALDRYPERLDLLAGIHPIERRCDEIVDALRVAIGAAFSTPVDRRDLLALALAIDDVIDRIDDVADEVVLYRPVALPEQARAQGRVLMAACEGVGDAIGRLPRLGGIGVHLEEIRAFEEEGDRLRRDATARLFHSGLDALEIVRLKSIHEALEEAIDACRAVADRIATLAIKNRW